MNDAARLARRIIEATEAVGLQMAIDRDPNYVPEPQWGFDGLSPKEQEGLVLAARYLLNKGYVVMGPNA